MFCPLGALRVAKGVCDFCDETTLEEMREDVFSYFENSNKNVFFKTCFGKNFHECASLHDKISESTPPGGSSSVRTQISDFIAAKRRGNSGKIMDSKIIGKKLKCFK